MISQDVPNVNRIASPGTVVIWLMADRRVVRMRDIVLLGGLQNAGVNVSLSVVRPLSFCLPSQAR